MNKIQDALNEAANEHGAKCSTSPRDNFDLGKISFKTGFQACLDYLTEKSDKFSYLDVHRQLRNGAFSHLRESSLLIECLICAVKYQHQKDQLIIQALKNKIEFWKSECQQGITHTCHAECTRLQCVQGKEIAKLEAELLELKNGK